MIALSHALFIFGNVLIPSVEKNWQQFPNMLLPCHRLDMAESCDHTQGQVLKNLNNNNQYRQDYVDKCFSL